MSSAGCSYAAFKVNCLLKLLSYLYFKWLFEVVEIFLNFTFLRQYNYVPPPAKLTQPGVYHEAQPGRCSLVTPRNNWATPSEGFLALCEAKGPLFTQSALCTDLSLSLVTVSEPLRCKDKKNVALGVKDQSHGRSEGRPRGTDLSARPREAGHRPPQAVSL